MGHSHKVHTTTSEIPFEQLKKGGSPLPSQEYIIDKINLRQAQKDCLFYAGNQHSVLAEHVDKDVSVVAINSMLATYYEGKQNPLLRMPYQKKDTIVNPQHYRRLTTKQTRDAENVLLEQGNVLDFP